MSTTTVARPATPLDVIALQYANPTRMVTIPITILLGVVVVTSGITLVLASGGGGVVESNGSVIWSLLGFVVAIGVQAVSVVFPLALALGSTRRTFTMGVLGTAVLEAVLLTVASLVLLGLELVTGGWFSGARVLRDATLGGGDPAVLVAVMALSALSAITAGALFGASWVRFGARGPLALGLGLAAVLVAAVLLLAPAFGALAQAFAPWWLAVAAAGVVVASTAGAHLLLRGASVR
jgi:hypothetical protein